MMEAILDLETYKDCTNIFAACYNTRTRKHKFLSLEMQANGGHMWNVFEHPKRWAEILGFLSWYKILFALPGF